MDPHAKREPILALLTTLNSRFASNLNAMDAEVLRLLEVVD